MNEKQERQDDYFGLCPHCHRTDGYLNVGRNHWMRCDEHRVTWHMGNNVFSGWRDETKEDWRRNYELIKDYEEVEPFLWPETVEHSERIRAKYYAEQLSLSTRAKREKELSKIIAGGWLSEEDVDAIRDDYSWSTECLQEINGAMDALAQAVIDDDRKRRRINPHYTSHDADLMAGVMLAFLLGGVFLKAAGRLSHGDDLAQIFIRSLTRNIERH